MNNGPKNELEVVIGDPNYDGNRRALEPHPKYGSVQAYREFIPRRNAIEYTVYFKLEGETRRADFDVHVDDVEPYRDQPELLRAYIVGRLDESIARGDHRDARNAVS